MKRDEMMKDLIIEKVSPGDAIPFHLLLLADETIDAIEKYIHTSDIYVAKDLTALGPIAVFVLQPQSATEMEIKNIAVSPHLQGMGYGSLLIAHIRHIVGHAGYKVLTVGTADQGIGEIAFYKKNGFELSGVKKNFFIKNYPAPIIENGIMLRDMVMLKMDLENK